MELRKSREVDIDNIIKIIKQAQLALKEQGIDQWQNNYPNKETIIKDIQDDFAYVLLKDSNIVGTVALSFDGEKTYESIFEGQWITDDKYAVIHRLAVDNAYKGIGISSQILKEIEQVCVSKKINSIKVDTHEKNIAMQKMLKKNNFEYCGIIYLEDNSKRIAFEKIIGGKVNIGYR
ncbi:GNAT family N-acetyltransferase [Clostridium grantii]|uniref:Acetyltransferase (GNAT) domain-containing protein n=1 Tax=Clostridium grantii DSM 8605 TaxID=1121316 RepID=A0A1M5VRA6_9CLOT|nr:GNAT family N-acetyltransferase [Clostridium grantii]SHH77514.1 Acetyltransferase (GNAT) domain-containing protein [Clostridium grantii DSM 8605]